jgi:hypothetical protein
MNRNWSGSRLILALAIMVNMVAGACACASDFASPGWVRGAAGTTYEQWTFSTNSQNNVAPDSYLHGGSLPYTPYLYVNSTYQYNSAAGAWPLGELDIFVPNFLNNSQGTEKQIQIQLTWQGANNNYMPPQPAVGVVPDFSTDPTPYTITNLSRKDYSPVNGWKQSLFLIDIEPNPSEEWIVIKGDILVDKVTIDTICIPEPATLGLLIGGALMAIRRKRKV